MEDRLGVDDLLTDVAKLRTWITAASGVGPAPNDAQYVVLALHADLTAERVLTAGNSITVTDGGAGLAVTVALATPGTCTATSTNSAAGNHTHAIGSTLARSAITITAGAGLTGGGNLTANLTLTVGAGNGITVNADDVALTTPGTCTATSTNSAAGNHTHAIDSTLARSAITITAGAGLTGGGDLTANRTLTVGAGAGITVNADDVALTTPGTCTATSTNSAAGNHTHAVTNSTGQTASCIVATDANSGVKVKRLAVGAGASVPGADGVALVAGVLYINETSNAGMSIGVTVNQGAATNEAAAFKAAEVAHGITNYTETDTFGDVLAIQYGAVGSGGINIRGFSEATAAAALTGCATADDTTKSAAGRGHVEIYAHTKSGTGLAAPGADANLMVIRSSASTRFIFDQEGELHSDAIIGVGDDWDEYDDLVLAADLSRMIRGRWDEVIRYNLADFERAGLVTVSVDEVGRTHAFIKHRAFLQFYACAFRDVYQRMQRVEQMLEAR